MSSLMQTELYGGKPTMWRRYSRMSASALFGLMGLVGRVVGPREGFYDGDHRRYYHENAWHECGDLTSIAAKRI
jgi:hypothetical protein